MNPIVKKISKLLVIRLIGIYIHKYGISGQPNSHDIGAVQKTVYKDRKDAWLKINFIY